MNAPNPKKLYGDKKPALHLLPLAGMIHQSLAHMDGDYKYGFENWNEFPVEKLTYIGAILRHVELYKYGETHARDTGVHNLGAVMACCAILLDAELNGNMIDNAKHSKATCDLLHNAEALVDTLKDMQKKREEEKALKAQTFEALKAATKAHCQHCDAFVVAPCSKDMSLGCTMYKHPFKTCGRCQSDRECELRGYCLA